MFLLSRSVFEIFMSFGAFEHSCRKETQREKKELEMSEKKKISLKGNEISVGLGMKCLFVDNL